MEKLLQGARKILRECMAIKEGETLLIITDPKMSFRISQALFQAGEEMGAIPTIVYSAPVAIPGDDPSEIVSNIMKHADVIITPASTTLFHCPAMKAALRAGARVGAMSEADEELLTGNALRVDFKQVQPMIHRVGTAFDQGSTLRFTTSAGTDITASIAGRNSCCNDALVHEAGTGQGVPDLETYIAPVEGTGNGTLVIDASASAIGLIEDAPIVITIKDGFAVDIQGGKEAEQLKQILAAAGSANAYNLAEMALGMNPYARIRGKIIEDESTLGTCHCALGTNLNFGGNTAAPVHIDMVQRDPTVYLDGKIIMKDGELLL